MRLAVFHFAPLEDYPPIMNFLRVAAEEPMDDLDIVVYTTARRGPALFNINSTKIHIKRMSSFSLGRSLPYRLISYITYNIFSFFSSLAFRPDRVLYFETLSAFVPFLLKRYLMRRIKLFIHYHEYMSPLEYANGMFLNRYFYRLEKMIFKYAAIISQTNQFRINLFLKDNPSAIGKQMLVLPNYPPASWKKQQDFHKSRQDVINIVYLGAFDMKNFYMPEFIRWVEMKNGYVKFDIYSQKKTDDLQKFLDNHQICHTTYKGYVDYADLPSVLNRYQVGVILYKPYSENAIFNAPNKLFEYYNAGLDVWFPSEQTGAMEYVTSGTYPRIIPVDFEDIQNIDLPSIVSRNGLERTTVSYFCEPVYKNYLNRLIN